jgi:hypothetical protein
MGDMMTSGSLRWWGNGPRLDGQGAPASRDSDIETLFDRLSGGQAQDLAEQLSADVVRQPPATSS